MSGRLLNSTVARRAFGVLGPTETACSMLAFLACFVVDGWRPGDTFPDGPVLLAASGAAFMTVVIAQTANAFACRSSTRWPGALGWFTNRLLLVGIGFALVFSFAVLFIGPVADELGQANPPLIGWLVAVASAGVLLAVDAFDKNRRRRRQVRSSQSVQASPVVST